MRLAAWRGEGRGWSAREGRCGMGQEVAAHELAHSGKIDHAIGSFTARAAGTGLRLIIILFGGKDGVYATFWYIYRF